MRRSLLVLAVSALLVVACENQLGRGVPECEGELSASMVLQVQSVPSARYVSCINALRTGWEYDNLEAESGRSVYALNSDRMGLGFVTVQSVLSCDPADAEPAETTTPGVTLFKDVSAETTADIVLVPERPSEATTARALELLNELRNTEVKDRSVNVSVSTGDEPTAARISMAAATGAHVISISIRDAEEGTLSLLVAGSDDEDEVDDLDEALERIEDAESVPHYQGTWYWVFDGGCVVYTFNARGAGVSTLEEDVRIALGLMDAEALRRIARQEGFNI